MILPRRAFLQLAAGVAAVPALARTACAQAYPSRPVHIVIGFPAGNPIDTTARLLGQWLSERLGQPVVIDNKRGEGSNAAAQAVAGAPADGYTLLWMTTANATGAAHPDLRLNLLRDIVPVAGVIRLPMVLVVHPSMPIRTIPEFIAHAKANPGKLRIASAGTGGISHLCGEWFKSMTGVSLEHVPHRDWLPARSDVVAGQVHAMIDVVSGALPYIRDGKVRALGVTSAGRSSALPDVPAIGETVPGYDANAWIGVGAPAGTPPEIVARLNRETNSATASPRINAQFALYGAVPMALAPAEFGAFLAAELDKWGKVVRSANVKLE